MNNRDGTVVDWIPPRRKRRRGRVLVLAVLAFLLLAGGSILSYYVDALWFDSLGYGDVFWKTLRLQSQIFTLFAATTFVVLYGSFVAIKPPRLGELTGIPILINNQPITLPVEPVLRLIAVGGSALLAFVTGLSMVADWQTLALYWNGAGTIPAATTDPIFARNVSFYLFTLPAYQLVSGWLMTLAVVVTAVAAFFALVTSGTRVLGRGSSEKATGAWRGL